MERAGFKKLLDRLELGDVLIVSKLDRLGRNAMDVRSTVERLAGMGVKVHCLALGGVDLTSPAGKMTMAVISAVSEMERDLLIERTQAGLQRAKAGGKKLGRKPKLKGDDLFKIAEMKAGGASLATMANEFGVSRSAIQHVIRNYWKNSSREIIIEFTKDNEKWKRWQICSKEYLWMQKENSKITTGIAKDAKKFRAIEVDGWTVIDEW